MRQVNISYQCMLHAFEKVKDQTAVRISIDELQSKDMVWTENQFQFVLVGTLNTSFTWNQISLDAIDANQEYTVLVEKGGRMKCAVFRCVCLLTKQSLG